jgi:integrase
LPPIVKNTLAEWRKVCPPSAAGLVFPNGAGKPESLANIRNRFWGPLQVACGITTVRPNRAGELVTRPRYGLHVTRHFYASWLIAQGLPPKRVQALMGHSTIKLTLDIYAEILRMTTFWRSIVRRSAA